MIAEVTFVFLALSLVVVQSLPPLHSEIRKASAQTPPHQQPKVITIERLESLLQKASAIFRPVAHGFKDLPVTESEDLEIPIEYTESQRQPYTFYLPLLKDEDSDLKVDEKTQKIGNLSPPPKLRDERRIIFSGVKPNKSPKKFNAASKHINVKWLNTYEKQLSSPGNKDAVNIPKDVYLANDERNRINFDDSFFAIDMKVPDRTNKLEKPQPVTSFGQLEDDSMPTAALQVPIIAL